MNEPWEHPDWYDLHDTTWTAGPQREPEHYQELLLALPPLDRDDHLIDVGAGTGKLTRLIATGYPRLGRVTLIDPNEPKLARAHAHLTRALPDAEVATIAAGLAEGAALPAGEATIVTVGSVLMVMMEYRGGTLADGLTWLRRGLGDIHEMLAPGAWCYALETLAAPWSRGGPDAPARRLHMQELLAELDRAGFAGTECVYRVRDRVIVKAQRPSGSVVT